jgi:hypothetical protein
MTTKEAGWCKLTQLMAHHVFANEDRHMSATIMHSNGMTHELRKDGGCSRPCLNDFALASAIHVLNPFEQFQLDKRPFFQ